MEQGTVDELRRRLTLERGELVQQLEDLGVSAETGEPDNVEFEHGFADSGQATAEKANVLSIVEGLLETLHEVDAALVRMDEGRFGSCDTCGSVIPAERLDARPYARLCITCKQRAGG